MNGGFVILTHYGSKFALCSVVVPRGMAKENGSLQSLTLTRPLGPSPRIWKALCFFMGTNTHTDMMNWGRRVVNSVDLTPRPKK